MVLKDTNLWPYALTYGAAYLGLEVIHQLFVFFLEQDASLVAYTLCLGGAAVFTGRRFQKNHRRPLTDRERKRLTHMALLVTSLITLIDTLLLVGRVLGPAALATPLETFHQTIQYPLLLAGAVLVFVLFSYGLLRLSFGYLCQGRAVPPGREERACSSAVFD